jgi:hypothetical protein
MKSGEVFVPRLNPFWPPELVDKWLGEVYHEIGHHAPELGDMLPLMDAIKLKCDSLLGKLMNVFEDVRNEMNHRGRFPGRDVSLSRIQAFYCKKGVESIKEHGLPTDDKDMCLVAQALALAYDWRKKYQPDLALPSLQFSEMVEWGRYSHLQSRLDTLLTAQDVHDLALEFLEESPDHDKEEEEEKATQPGEGEGEEGEGEGEGGSGKSDGSDDDEGKPTGGKVSYKDLMGHLHSDKRGEGYQVEIVYDHEHRHDYIPWEGMRVVRARDLDAGTKTTKNLITRYYDSGKVLASVARRLFQSRTQSRTSHNHLTGRLDKRDLYRVPSGNKDVFKRKELATNPKGTALFLLTDASGSMQNADKFEVTGAAVALLNDACSPLGIPLKIAAFTERYPQCSHFVVKEYDERRTPEAIIDDYTRIEKELYQNADGESVMWAATDLIQRKEARKILIVLSDGQPSADNEGDVYTYTKEVVKAVAKWPNMEVYGIGILSDAVKDFYHEYTVLNDVHKLEECLINLVKTKIFKE